MGRIQYLDVVLLVPGFPLYKDETVVRPSYHYNGSSYTKEAFDIE